MRMLVALVVLPLIVVGAEPIDYVNTKIGAISHLLVPTFRTVQLPNAMYRFNSPDAKISQDRIDAIWLQYPGHRDKPVFSIQPYSGAASGALKGGWWATLDHAKARPYRYDVCLDSMDVRFSLVPARRGGLASFSFRRGECHALRFGKADGEHREEGFDCDGRILTGRDRFWGFRKTGWADVYLFVEFDRDPSKVATTADGKTVVYFGDGDETVNMRFAVSYQSAEQAAANLREELPNFDLGQLADSGRRIWNDRLSVVEVEGGTENEKTVFYTALWRTFERMVDITEGGRYYGYDRKIHDTKGVPFYTDDWTWDTWRAAHPLMTIICPSEESHKLASYVRMAEESPERWMPVFPEVCGDRHCMVNRHVSVMMLDAWRKGIRDFDVRKAFELIDHTEETESLIPWYRGPLTELDRFYKKNGYYPGLREGEVETVEGVMTDWERRQCVSVTQGASLDAWAIAGLGREIGIDPKRLAKYDERAVGYRKLWNAKTQFFHPRSADGKFIEPFDYILCGGFGARNYYTENNAWIYVWDVQHDIDGLIALFGGKEAMEAKLDLMRNTTYKGKPYKYVNDMPDGCTGLMGAFTMANEPAFHIPYLYNFTGHPEKTQKFVRKTLELWFRNDLMGMCGDEDGGGMSAYAVFSMMGFYPVTPGKPEYQWGSPVFRKVTIHLQNGRKFVLEAPDASEEAKYIRTITIDGRRMASASVPLQHEDIVRGARVVIRQSEDPR